VGLAATLLTGVLIAAPGLPASAAPSTSPSPAAGQKVCQVNDERLGNDALTGMAATAKGYDVINDNDASQTVQIYQISTACQVQKLVVDDNQPNTPADLAVTADGSIWVADIGDPQQQRQSIAIWKFTGGNDGATLYHLTYPDGAHNAASMLVPANGQPVIVTKQAGQGVVYVPTAALNANQAVPLKKAGAIALKATGTPGGPLGPTGQRVFSGGAVSPDGKRAVLRTYTDAYEWDVTGGDVATSIVKGKPRRTPLPNEPDGEAISYSTDGKTFLTMADAKNPLIDRYTPAVAAVAGPSAKAKQDGGGNGLLGLFGQGLTGITNIVIAVGVVGLLLVVVGFIGVRRSRRNNPIEDDDPVVGRGPGGDDGETVVLPRYTDEPASAGTARLRPPPPAERGRVHRSAMAADAPPPRRPAPPDDIDTDVMGVVHDDPIPPRNRPEPPPPPPRGRPEPPPVGPRGRPEPPTSRGRPEPRSPRGRAEPLPGDPRSRPEPLPGDPRGRLDPPRDPRDRSDPPRGRQQPSQPDTGWSAGSRWRDEERPRGGRDWDADRTGSPDRSGRADRYDRYDGRVRPARPDRDRPPYRGGYPDDEPEPYRPRSR
jgi:hypothetical protein